MTKYNSLEKDIHSVFASVEWQAEDIKTFPQNFIGSVVGDEYIRFALVASGNNTANIPRSTAGLVMVDIFVPAGAGYARATQIADKLDKYLAGKSLKTTVYGNTQLGSSNLSPRGADTANPSLFRASYSVPFNFFGVR